jgi:hypothetical protein
MPAGDSDQFCKRAGGIYYIIHPHIHVPAISAAIYFPSYRAKKSKQQIWPAKIDPAY